MFAVLVEIITRKFSLYYSTGLLAAPRITENIFLTYLRFHSMAYDVQQGARTE